MAGELTTELISCRTKRCSNASVLARAVASSATSWKPASASTSAATATTSTTTAAGTSATCIDCDVVDYERWARGSWAGWASSKSSRETTTDGEIKDDEESMVSGSLPSCCRNRRWGHLPVLSAVNVPTDLVGAIVKFHTINMESWLQWGWNVLLVST